MILIDTNVLSEPMRPNNGLKLINPWEADSAVESLYNTQLNAGMFL
jgi:predicted nucleic acid-binding protein